MKYKTRKYDEANTLVLRTPKGNRRWPRHDLDVETLIVDTTNRAEAVRIAKETSSIHWG